MFNEMKSSILYDIIEDGEGKRELTTTLSKKIYSISLQLNFELILLSSCLYDEYLK